MSLFVSVVVRSYNRLETLPALLDAVLAQRYDDFEVVVVDQSTIEPAHAVAAIAARRADPRLRWFHFEPLGGAKARNKGVGLAKGDIVLFVDDDDMPAGSDWIARHVENYADHNCMGVTGRQDFGTAHPPYPWFSFSSYRCMRFGRITKMPWTYGQRTERHPRVDYVHGTNGSVRKQLIEELGGWDEDTSVEDESSFGYKAARHLTAAQYFCFDPRPEVRRGVAATGGLAKRFMSMDRFVERYCEFVHRIVARYHPQRVAWLTPIYVIWLLRHTLDWVWDDSQLHATWRQRIPATWELVWRVPWVYFRTRRKLRGLRLAAG